MKTDAPSTVVRSNTISEALGPTIFVPMQCSWKKLVCDGFIPVGPDGNPKSTLEICPALALDQRLLFANTTRISSKEQLVAKMKPRFPFMYALNLSNPALGQSLWPICKPFRITVFLPHRTSVLPQRAIRKEALPPASCTGSTNETTMLVVGLASPVGRVTVPFGTITCSATAKLTSLPARPTKGLPLESRTALACPLWFGCNSWSNTTTKVRHETFSEVTG